MISTTTVAFCSPRLSVMPMITPAITITAQPPVQYLQVDGKPYQPTHLRRLDPTNIAHLAVAVLVLPIECRPNGGYIIPDHAECRLTSTVIALVAGNLTGGPLCVQEARLPTKLELTWKSWQGLSIVADFCLRLAKDPYATTARSLTVKTHLGLIETITHSRDGVSYLTHTLSLRDTSRS